MYCVNIESNSLPFLECLFKLSTNNLEEIYIYIYIYINRHKPLVLHTLDTQVLDYLKTEYLAFDI